MMSMDHGHHTFRQGMGFSRASTSIDEKRSLYGIDRFLLLRIESRHARECIQNREKCEEKTVLLLAFSGFSHILANTIFSMDLNRLFGSRSRVKLLEKFVIEDIVSDSKTGFFIRELCRELDEQINAVRRELMNLENMGLLKSYEENKKKYYLLNKNCPIYPEISEMFLKAYDVMVPIKAFFKGKKNLDLVTVSEAVLDFRNESTNNIVDIFIIGDLDRIEFNHFLEKTFFGKKIKYAIMSLDDFTNRLEYNDKLVLSILSQKGNIFLKDRLDIEASIESKVLAMNIFH